MRRIQEHHRTARRALSTLVVGVVALTTAVMTASPAGADAPRASTPLEAYDSFEFEFELSVGNGTGPGLTIATKGTYAGSNAQECAATATFQPGFDYEIRAVVVGDKVWIDEGRGPKKASRRDFDFEDECPSSRGFWADFPFADLPRGMHGTAETRNGIAVEKFDVTEILGAVTASGFAGIPDDVTAQRAVIWRAKRHDVVVGLDLAFTGNSEDTCREMLEQDPGTPTVAACSMTLRLDLSNFDHAKVHAPSGSKKHKKTISA